MDSNYKNLNINYRNFNFYANTSILLLGLFIILYLLKRKPKDLRDEKNYDWTKYTNPTDMRTFNKKAEIKEKVKTRVKENSKDTGFVKEEHRFPKVGPKQESEKFLTFEDADNLQDMINFVASMSQNEKSQTKVLPIESLYDQIANSNYTNNYTNINLNSEQIDNAIKENLKSSQDISTRINNILSLYSKLLKQKNKKLSESTYQGIVELFLKNGYLNHASYFLCKMDELKLQIPRSLLDLFVDYCTTNKIYEQINSKPKNGINNHFSQNNSYNKFDKYDVSDDPAFALYFSRRNNFTQKNMATVFSKLNIDAKPFYPKKEEDEGFEKIKSKLAEIDPNNIKEYIPKNYRIVRKENGNN